MKLKLNQTLIKMLKKGGECPRYIKDVMLDPATPAMNVPTESQMKGLVFEKLALTTNDEHVKEAVDCIPLLKSGKVPVDYERISDQAIRFKKELKVIYELDIESKNKQVYLETEYNNDVIIHGTLDFMSPIKDDAMGKIPMAIHDLKLTGSIFKQFGDHSWAFPYNIDHTQAHMYKKLAKAVLGWTLPFYYWVFDYSPDKNFKIFRKETTSIDSHELEESIRMSVERLNLYDKNGWVEFASATNCRECPLKDVCKSYSTRQIIEVI